MAADTGDYEFSSVSRGSAFHTGRVLVGFYSPTPTTCRCPSACWAAERDCPSLALALAASISPSSVISMISGLVGHSGTAGFLRYSG
jgi:hypothetical protein